MILLNQILYLLAKNNNDERGWSQYLIFLVMAVIWIFGGISKYKRSKVNKSDFPEEEPDYDQIGRALKQKKSAAQQQKRKLHEKLTPPTKKKSPLKKQKFKLKDLTPLEMPKKITKITPTTAETLIKLQTPNDLKAAILYHEILGKPLSLRDYNSPN